MFESGHSCDLLKDDDFEAYLLNDLYPSTQS